MPFTARTNSRASIGGVGSVSSLYRRHIPSFTSVRNAKSSVSSQVNAMNGGFRHRQPRRRQYAQISAMPRS